MITVSSRAAAEASRRKARGSRTRVDLGRLIMVPLAASALLLQVVHLAHYRNAGLLAWLGAALTFAFYSLIIWNYLRRGPAKATSSSITASAIAVIATMSPTALPLLHAAPPGIPRQATVDVLLVGGTVWSVWSLRFLGKNLSVLAQARDLADRGPYRLVRHPLYTGELVSAFGLALAAGNFAVFAAWVALLGMQVYRAMQEEKVLLQALPGYRDYRARTAALIPGLF